MPSTTFLTHYKTNITHCFCSYIIICNKHSLPLTATLQYIEYLHMHEGSLTLTGIKDCFLGQTRNKTCKMDCGFLHKCSSISTARWLKYFLYSSI
jgi:hypothetical protein